MLLECRGASSKHDTGFGARDNGLSCEDSSLVRRANSRFLFAKPLFPNEVLKGGEGGVIVDLLFIETDGVSTP